MAHSQDEKPKQQVSPTSYSNHSAEDEFDLGDFVNVLRRKKVLVLGVFLAGTIAAALLSLLLPEVYQASASIMVLPSKLQSVMSPAQFSLDLEKTNQGEYVQLRPTMSLSTHKALLKSNDVLEQVLERLKKQGGLEPDMPLESLRNNLQVLVTEETNVLELVALNTSPAVAKEIVNTWADVYLQYSREMISGEIKGSHDFISEQFESARKDLTEAERALDNFNVTERVDLLQIELKEKNERLDSHFGRVWKLELDLSDKKDELQKVRNNLTAMSRNGQWLGAFAAKEVKEIQDYNELDQQQKSLRRRVAKATVELEEARRRRDKFVNETNIELLREVVKSKRKDLSAKKSLLSKVNQRCRATKVNLESRNNMDMLAQLRTPLAENLSDLTVWEILSLSEGYNFFETRKESLVEEIKQQEAELQKLEESLLEYSNQLEALNEAIARAGKNYDFYLNRFEKLQNDEHSLKLQIANLEHELRYSGKMADNLEGQVEKLQQTINEKKAERTKLERELEICRQIYNKLSSKVDEMQIAKAMKLGEVKQVSNAFEPRYPVKPRKKMIVAGAGAVSLLLGVVFAFVPEFGRREQ